MWTGTTFAFFKISGKVPESREFLKIIKYVIQDANVFVISHKTGLDERFENVLKFEKVKGFSSKVS